MEILVGIDFGTTNSIIVLFNNNKTEIIYDNIFKTIPSKIGFINEKTYCGNSIPLACVDIIHSFKMFIDEKYLIENNNNYLQLYEKKIDINYLLSIFFKHIYDLIYEKTKSNNISAVITVPSNFNDKQRELIKNAYEINNIKVLRIINEPSAAALSYGLNYSSQDNEKILVIDTGGGTMDFTILEKNNNFFEVINSDGLNNLGGNDFTKIIFEDIITYYKNNNINITNNIIWNQAQLIKEKLSYLDEYEIKTGYKLSIRKFEKLSLKLIKLIEEKLNYLLLNDILINFTILVGNTSKIPFLQKTIKNITNNIWIHTNLDSVVAEGAAIYAGILSNKYSINNEIILLDVLSLSIGVELADGSYSIIIPKNTQLPIKKSQKYTTDTPGDDYINIKIYQGENRIANNNFLIGEIKFDKLSVGITPIIEITFKVDCNSIINVIITDKKTNNEKTVILKNINNNINNSHIIDKIDNSELIKLQNIYLIKTNIEYILNYINKNNIHYKNELLKKIEVIENYLENMNNNELIDNLQIIINEKNKLENINLNNFNDISNYYSIID